MVSPELPRRMDNTKRTSRLKFPLFLLIICGISYGLLVPWLGFYWDDLPMGWIPYQLGPAGAIRYFSTNRPVWGWLYLVTTPILGMTPWAWQVFAILFRWISGLSLCHVLKRVWPERTWIGETAALFMVLFPAFRQQYISLLYSHFFIVLSGFFLSLGFMLAAIDNPKRKNIYTAIGMFFSAMNLFMLEYFFTLEIVRPLFIGVVTHKEFPRYRQLTNKVLRTWLPYLILFIVATIWRLFFYTAQTKFYQFQIIPETQEQPVDGLLELANRIASSMWVVILQSWKSVFDWIDILDSGKRILGIYMLVVLATAGLTYIYFLKLRMMNDENYRSQARVGWGLMGFGLASCLIAGIPVWSVGRKVLIAFPEDRFSLPFLFGFSIFFAGLVEIIPRIRWLRIGVLAVTIGLMAGFQYRLAEAYVVDWEAQKNFFWQLNWRVPDLEPGTILLTNILPFTYYSDNSLAAPLNWLYAPDNHSDRLDYMLYYPEKREGGGKLAAIQPDLDISHDYLGAVFNGNTTNSIAAFFSRRSCLRILEAYPESNNPLLPLSMKEAASFSAPQQILVNGKKRLPQPLYGPEPEHNWCYYFETADLARQSGDWVMVLETGEMAISQGLTPKDGSECYPFVVSSFHLENYDSALEWTLRGTALNDELVPYYCEIWRNHVLSMSGDETDKAWQMISNELSCEW